MIRLFRTAAPVLFALLAAVAHADPQITCSVTNSGGWTAAYVTSAPGNTVTQSSFQLNCQRTVASDPTTLNYIVEMNDGANTGGGGQNRAKLTTASNFINYEDYKDSTCTTVWKANGANRFTGAMSLTGFATTSLTINYWGCIPPGQTGLPSGTYQDMPTMTVKNGGTILTTNTFTVTIYYPAVCNVTTAPGNVAFNYTAFRATPLPASTTFGVTCTSTLPYTLALDTTSGVVVGLQYLISLSSTSATGNGSEQPFTINGTMPAGQAGTCATGSCNGTHAHSITITY
jgi:spore coat protein U-like protein